MLCFGSGVEKIDSLSKRFPGVLSVGDSIENRFAGDWITFPSASASVDCLARPDFLVGASCLAASNVFFLLARFGDGAVFSEVDDPESPDDVDVSLSDCFFWVSAVVDSVWNFNPLVGVRCVAFPPVVFP